MNCIDEISENAKLYLQTVLNGLTPKLDAYLVRDIKRIFLDSDLLLPITEDGNIDYDWMELYIKEGKEILKKQISNWMFANNLSLL